MILDIPGMTPDDVYALIVQRSDRTYNLIFGAATFVSLLIVGVFVPVAVLLWWVKNILRRVQLYLDMVERHAELNEQQKKRNLATLEELKAAAVTTIPDQVKAAVHEVIDGSKSGVLTAPTPQQQDDHRRIGEIHRQVGEIRDEQVRGGS